MHDPMVVLFDVRLPPPRFVKGYPVTRWKDGVVGGEVEHLRWAFTRGRYTNPEPEFFGKPIYRWYRPAGYEVGAFGRRVSLRQFITVWHVEPGGRDAGTVCKGRRGSAWNWANVRFMFGHLRHLHLQVHPWQHVRSRFERCAECHRRMNKAVRIGTSWDSPGVLHNECHQLRTLRWRLADHHAYVEGRADNTTKWRVENGIEHRLVSAAENVLKEAERRD